MFFLEKWRSLAWLALSSLILPAATAQNFNLELKSSFDLAEDQYLGNVGGYAQDGREYALLCGKSFYILNVTNPESPTQVLAIPTTYGTREVKTYRHYAYVVNDNGPGLLIIDLSNLPDTNLAYHYYYGDGDLTSTSLRHHTLHIDTARNFLYLHGRIPFDTPPEGSVVLDLNLDPYHPTYLGAYDQIDWVHDGFVENDTLYACHAYAGLLAVVDMTDKQNPVVLGTVQTPGKVTHSSWLLSDHKHLLTTDETNPSFLTSYDVSDPTDLKELDKVAITPNGANAIIHNVDVINDWAVVSWYNYGVVLVDAHRPDNLVITGWYDTTTDSTATYDGCYGAFPHLPSGVILADNIHPARLIILQPEYVRAAYLEGSVTDYCGNPLNGIAVTINSASSVSKATNLTGQYKIGQLATGLYSVTFSKPGFVSQTVEVNFVTAEVVQLDILLASEEGVYLSSGNVLNTIDQLPVNNQSLTLQNDYFTYLDQTDGSGQFVLGCINGGIYNAGIWGYELDTVAITDNTPITLNMTPNPYFDDFEIDFGWTVEASASEGTWERGIPYATYFLDGGISNPGTDSNADANGKAFLTGNPITDNSSTGDLDGTTVLISPPLQLAEYENPVLSFSYWLSIYGTTNPLNGLLKVYFSNGNQAVKVFQTGTRDTVWRQSGDIHLTDFLPLTDTMFIEFHAETSTTTGVIEMGIDAFKIRTGESSGLQAPDPESVLAVSPNPSSSHFVLEYNWPGVPEPILEVRDPLGRTVLLRNLSAEKSVARFGADWPHGVYLVSLRSTDGRRSAPLKIVKQ